MADDFNSPSGSPELDVGSNIVPGPGGSLLKVGSLKSNSGSKGKRWSLNANGSMEFGGSSITGLNLEDDGVSGLYIESITGSDISSYLFGSAGFAMPGGLFDGSIYPSVTDVYSIGRDDFVTLRWLDIYLVNAPTVSSDIRFKKNVRDTKYGLSDIEKLRPIQYTRYDDEHIGFSAQELREVLPELVKENKAGHLSVRFEEIIPVLVNAIKQLSAQVSELKK